MGPDGGPLSSPAPGGGARDTQLSLASAGTNHPPEVLVAVCARSRLSEVRHARRGSWGVVDLLVAEGVAPLLVDPEGGGGLALKVFFS